jgi:hypothetical protein
MAMSGGTVMGSGAKRKRPHKHLCGTPKEYCTGSYTSASNGLSKGGGCKAHGTPQDAFKCYAKHLISQGYTQIGSREFAAPNNGPIVFLTKKSRFGARCRGGKAERFMPEGYQGTGGTIISC